MTARKLDKAEWKAYFDKISKVIAGSSADVEILSQSLGDQIQSKWMPLHGIVYDPKNDIVEIILNGLDHIIHHPTEINVDDGRDGLTSLEVVDQEEFRTVVQLRGPLVSTAANERR